MTGAQPAAPQPGRFGDDPWRLSVTGLDPAMAGVDETLFALGNGYLGLRGNHEEGPPLGQHGTFLNGLHETWRISHAEAAYGFAEEGQTIVNAPDAKTIRIFVDDERLNLGTAELLDYRRTLDLRAGSLSRSLTWLTPGGKRVLVESRRLVSFAHRHEAHLELAVTVLDDEADLTITSLLINRQDLIRERGRAEDSPASADPRQADPLSSRVLLPVIQRQEAGRSVLSFRVANSGMHVAVGTDDRLETENAWHRSAEIEGDRSRQVFHVRARPGQRTTLRKTAAYHSSAHGGARELVDRCVQTLDGHRSGAQDPWAEQAEWLGGFWARSDVRVGADPGTQQAVRWNLFQLAQAAARADGKGIAAKGVTGSGYSGHYFWDTEIYVLPFLSYTSPRWARNALRARQLMLPKARARAATLNEEGALFPWRTINGEEASAYYAAGTAQYHINADITFALAKYLAATGDREFLADGAADIAVETARLWLSLGFWRREADGSDGFHIHGVTGPDEYTTVVNDNLFTNVMARFNLRFAAGVIAELAAADPGAHRELLARLGLREEEPEAWLLAAEAMTIPYSAEAGVHPQDAHFLEREVWDLAQTPPEQKPLLLHFHPLVIYRFQVLKQADVVLATFLQGGEFTAAEKRANFDYYDRLTTGDSSLSATVQSVIAAEVGYRALALDYFAHALRVDLDDLHQNAADGVHVASAGGVWTALVNGFAGMRDHGGALSFDPRLPAAWTELSFALAWAGNRIEVSLSAAELRVRHLAGEQPVAFSVRGAAQRVEPGAETRVPLADQGPDLGEFAGLSAGMLPREGDPSPAGAEAEDIPVVTTTIPVLEPERLD